MKNIGFNIWDDYIEGEDTCGYVEEYDCLSKTEKHEICLLVFNAINSIKHGVLYSEFYCNYCEEYENIAFYNLFHATRDSLIKDLRSLNLKYKDIPISFYSES